MCKIQFQTEQFKTKQRHRIQINVIKAGDENEISVFLVFFRKAANVSVVLTVLGKLFHMVGPATAKLHLPTVLLGTVTASNVASLADRNARVGALRAIAQLR